MLGLQTLFCNSLIGCAKMMMETGKTHHELIDMVTSKGGTTFKGLEALARNHFDQALLNASMNHQTRL
jgi:pyrroline-5-carboxylate reductase